MRMRRGAGEWSSSRTDMGACMGVAIIVPGMAAISGEVGRAMLPGRTGAGSVCGGDRWSDTSSCVPATRSM